MVQTWKKDCFLTAPPRRQVLRLKQGFDKSLSAQMMTPIQRMTRYALLLKEIEKDLARGGAEEMRADALGAWKVSRRHKRLP